MIIACGGCNKKYTLNKPLTQKNAKFRCISCGVVFLAEKEVAPPGPQKAHTVIVANGDTAACDKIGAMIASDVTSVIKVYDGEATLRAVRKLRPDVLILDVAMPGIYGVVICEHIKNDPELKKTKVILVASIHKKTRFKRKPTSIYGADEYIENECIDESLLEVFNRMLGLRVGHVDAEAGKRDEAKPRAEHKHEEHRQPVVAKKAAPVEATKDQEHEKAVRLARVIVADIMLYHRKKIDFDIKSADIYMVFKAEITESMKYFEKKFPGVPSKGYILDAFKEALTNQKNLSEAGNKKASGAG